MDSIKTDMGQMPVIIAGGGIGGLSMALTLHQIGVPCLVFVWSILVLPLLSHDGFSVRFIRYVFFVQSVM